MTGTVKWFNPRKGYGFIDTHGMSVYVHRSNIKGSLDTGAKVEFDLGRNAKGTMATNVKVTG